jgi:threonine 3-dehydrogenase
MKALVKKERKPDLWLEEVPQPPVGVNDVLIRADRTGICGTDLHIYRWDDWAQRTIPVPLVVGHEFVGEVAEVETALDAFKEVKQELKL